MKFAVVSVVAFLAAAAAAPKTYKTYHRVKLNEKTQVRNEDYDNGKIWKSPILNFAKPPSLNKGDTLVINIDFGDKALNITDRNNPDKESIGFKVDGTPFVSPNNYPLPYEWKYTRVTPKKGASLINDPYQGTGRFFGKVGKGYAKYDLRYQRERVDFIGEESYFQACGIQLKIKISNTLDIDWDPSKIFLEADSDLIKVEDCMKGGRAGGEPHIKTFGSVWFDYHGECDLVLLHVPDFQSGIDLDLHVRTTIRYEYSYIESAALRLGEDILEVESYGDYFVNGVGLARLDDGEPITLAGFPIYYSRPDEKQHVFDVVIGPFANITISTFKDIVNVKLSGVDEDLYGNVTGLMGSYDGLTLARNGTTVITDWNEYGQEWQVLEHEPKLFNTLRAPQAPMEKCILPDMRAKEKRLRGRRLGENTVSREDAKQACSSVPEGPSRDACVFDVLSLGDLDAAKGGIY